MAVFSFLFDIGSGAMNDSCSRFCSRSNAAAMGTESNDVDQCIFVCESRTGSFFAIGHGSHLLYDESTQYFSSLAF